MIIKAIFSLTLFINFEDKIDFSYDNVMLSVGNIAAQPHPVGSSGHQLVARYLENQLTQLGVDFEIQRTFVSEKVQGGRIYAGVKNFCVRLKGEGSGHTVLFAAHYDSIPNSPGAGDNAISVAALLEALRWASKNKHRNDLMFLFVDSEELQLLGSKAFVETHSWAREVDLFFNFEGRGNAGSVYAFETTGSNLTLMREMRKALPWMKGTSLANDLYALMPNTTDFSHFKTLDRVQGVGFAHIGGPEHYHASTDSPAAVSTQTIRNHARNAHGLVAYFGSAALAEKGKGQAVFFYLPILGSVVYSQQWNMPIFIFTGVLVLLAFGVVFWKKHRVFKSFVLGLVVWPLVFLTGPIASIFFWNLSRIFNPHMDDNLAGHASYAMLFFMGLGFLTLACGWAIVGWFVKRFPPSALHLSLMVWWFAIAGLSALYSPGSLYALTLPLLVLLPVLVVTLIRNSQGWQLSTAFVFAGIPSLLLLFPLCYPIFLALPMTLVIVSGVLLAISVSWFLPSLAGLSKLRWLSGVCFALGLGCTLLGTFYNRSMPVKKPIPESLSYGVDHETEEAFWLSSDWKPGPWTTSFLKTAQPRAPHFLPGVKRLFLYGAATFQALDAPRIEVLADERQGKRRRLKILIQSTIKAENMFLEFASGSPVLSFTLGEEQLHRVTHPLRIFGIPASGLEFDIEVPATRDLEFKLVEMKRGLPAVAQRPSHSAPSPWLPYYQDVTLSLRKIVL